jgi:hypothetical protein
VSEARRATKTARRGRAAERWQHVALRQGDYDATELADAVAAKLAGPAPKTRRRAGVPKGFPANDTSRWVPIGPSVVRRGQGTGRPRVVGRVRDLAVSADGTRAYAASARGGVWYSGDGGGSWSPVGGWADRTRAALGTGGANTPQSCGAILVDFGNTAADPDLVLVGTGELVPGVGATTGKFGSVGVLAGRFVAPPALGTSPWEAEAGVGVLQGRGIYRLVRSPASTAGSTGGPTLDVVLAATSHGLVRGTRTAGAAPAPDTYQWARVPALDTQVLTALQIANGQTPVVTDVVWFGSGRIVVAVSGRGLYRSDDNGATFTALAGCNRTSGQWISGRITLARPFDPVAGTPTNGLYALTGRLASAGASGEGTPTLYAVADATVAAPVVTRPGPLPAKLWPGQMWYDQALWVEVVGTKHRVYVGGSYFEPPGPLSEDDGSVWCFEVSGANLRGVPQVSTLADGSAVDGFIGTGVHADVHAIRLAGPAGANRQVWVGCDGGVYVSGAAGKVNTFAPRAIGVAVLEVGFCAPHPTASHLVAAGMQDNGTQVRAGDTVWEEIFEGDGGGVLFDPSAPYRIVRQYIRAGWDADPKDGRFSSPTSKLVNGGTLVGDRENGNDAASFYSGAAAVSVAAGRTRLAIGTNRVWLTDNLGSAPVTTWGVLPFAPAGPAVDQRPHAPMAGPPYTLPPDPKPRFGVPAGALGLGAVLPNGNGPLGRVITLRWANPTVLVSLWEFGVVTWTEAPAGTWTAAVDLRITGLGAGSGRTVLTDVFPVPNSTDYYLTTTGSAGDGTLDTCYLVTPGAPGAAPTVTPTGLRGAISPPPALGPRDPAFAVVVDPAKPLEVYVGTVTGVWHGVRTVNTTTVAWAPTPFVNGLPEAPVQDLAIHYDPAKPTPRLLRAAIQARGVWEVDLAADTEPVRTYVRVHPFDDRRRLPTSLDNPRTPFPSPFVAGGSPDVVVRPRAGAGISPQWQGLPADRWTAANVPAYELWTFQTAFRWTYPSVQATGEWTPEFEQLVAFDRAQRHLTAGRFIDKALWDAVVGTRITAAGAVSGSAGDPLAVYQPPWRGVGAMTAGATEIDLMETVRPLAEILGFVTVHEEPCTVDVLLHHRDTRPVPVGQAHAIVLHRTVPLVSGNLATVDTTALTNWFRACAQAGTVQAAPTGWTIAGPAVGQPVPSLAEPLDARVPRALSFDLDLTGTGIDFVEILAAVWSDADRLVLDPVLPAAPAVPDLDDLVRGWPYVACRVADTRPRMPSPPAPGP